MSLWTHFFGPPCTSSNLNTHCVVVNAIANFFYYLTLTKVLLHCDWASTMKYTHKDNGDHIKKRLPHQVVH